MVFNLGWLKGILFKGSVELLVRFAGAVHTLCTVEVVSARLLVRGVV